MNIIQALHDSRYFYNALNQGGESWSWGSWEIFLKAAFGIPFSSPRELEVFRTCTELSEPPAERPKEIYCISGRKSGKSTMAALVAVFVACFTNWRKRLSPGEIARIFIIATDKEQAKIIKGYIMGFMELPHFRRLVRNVTAESIELENRCSITIKAASFRGVRGFTIPLLIAEELSFWRDERGSNPAQEIIRSVRPSITACNGVLLGVSSAYSRSGFLFEQFRDHFAKPGDVLVWKSTSKIMNPLLSSGMIERAVEQDPEGGRAEWLSEWRQDVSSFLDPEIVESATVPGRVELPALQEIEHVGFVDASGGRQDSFTLGIAHRSREGRAVLDSLYERRPPFSPESVVMEYCDVLRSYRITKVIGDKYGAEFVVELFRKHGIEYEACERTSSELFLEVLPMFTSGAVELLDSKRLRAQLCGLERKIRTAGRDQVGHYPGGHDDLALVCCGALVLAGHAGVQEGRVMSISGRSVSSSSSSSEPEESGGGRVFTSGAGRSRRDIDLEESFRRAIMHDNVDKAKSERDKRPPEDRD